MKTWTVLILLVPLIWGFVNGKCPPPAQIAPCTCKNAPNKPGIGTCSKFFNYIDMDVIFRKNSGWVLSSLVIDQCSMRYVPHSVVEQTRSDELIIRNSQFTSLFDPATPKTSEVKKLLISNVKVENRILWSYLSTSSKLTNFSVVNSVVRSFDESFKKNIPSGVKIVILENTKTLRVTQQAFSNLKQATFFVLKKSLLKTVSRDVFPQPWNSITRLDLSYNKLKSVPEDMFKSMPVLKFVNLDNNLFSTLPEKTFNLASLKGFESFSLSGNPLNCDCLMKWVASRKSVNGQCAEPPKLKGKKTRTLKPSDFPGC